MSAKDDPVDLATLRTLSNDELEEQFAHDAPFEVPTGLYRGVYLRGIASFTDRRLDYRVLQIAGFRGVERDCRNDASWTQDEPACEDRDECAESASACAADATFVNTEGSYDCACDDGFTGDGATCTATPAEEDPASSCNQGGGSPFGRRGPALAFGALGLVLLRRRREARGLRG